MKDRSVAKLWIVFATLCLLLSGALSLPMLLGKTAFFREFVGSTEWIRWSLVVHVILSSLVWFMALPAGLVQLMLSEEKYETDSKWQRLSSRFGLAITAFGVVLLSTSFLREGVRPILNNYIPVITHPRFAVGLALCFVGLLLGLFNPKTFLPFEKPSLLKTHGLAASRFGVWVGSLFFLFSFAFLVKAFFALKSEVLLGQSHIFEQLMWGPGHLLQHASSVFLIVSWTLLLSQIFDRSIFKRKEVFSVYALLSLPLLVLPFLFFLPVEGADYRESFTLMMRWGIFPAFILFFILFFYKLKKIEVKLVLKSFFQLENYKAIAFGGSSVLILLGFIYGALIRGPDLRVPAHYHATIGAVTLAFMAVVVLVCFDSTRRSKGVGLAFVSYFIGQSFFSTGMFVAGSFGVPRKTYGSEIVLSNVGQKTGFAMLAIGGSLALLGGSLFALFFLKLCYGRYIK